MFDLVLPSFQSTNEPENVLNVTYTRYMIQQQFNWRRHVHIIVLKIISFERILSEDKVRSVKWLHVLLEKVSIQMAKMGSCRKIVTQVRAKIWMLKSWDCRLSKSCWGNFQKRGQASLLCWICSDWNGREQDKWIGLNLCKSGRCLLQDSGESPSELRIIAAEIRIGERLSRKVCSGDRKWTPRLYVRETLLIIRCRFPAQ